MIKAIFFDIDGTLLYGNKGVPSKEIEDLRKLKKKGIKIVVCTGRAIGEVEPLHLDEYDFDAYIALNGQTIFDASYNLIYENLFDKDDLKKLINIFNSKDIVVGLSGEDGLYVNYVDDKLIKENGVLNIVVPRIDTYHNEKIYQALAYCDDAYKEKIKKELVNSKVTYWNDFGIDIFNKNGGKDKGILEYIKMFDITIDETMAFGDSENDKEMLKMVSIGVAMGNGTEELKEVSDFVTKDLYEDGIDYALRKYGVLND